MTSRSASPEVHHSCYRESTEPAPVVHADVANNPRNVSPPALAFSPCPSSSILSPLPPNHRHTPVSTQTIARTRASRASEPMSLSPASLLYKQQNFKAGWEYLSPIEVMEFLDSSLTGGLRDSTIPSRLSRHGPNELHSSKPIPVWKLFLGNFLDILMILLLIAGIVSCGLEQLPEGIAIFVIIIIDASLATYTEHSSGNALSALMDLTSPTCTVRRTHDLAPRPQDRALEMPKSPLLLTQEGEAAAAAAAAEEEEEATAVELVVVSNHPSAAHSPFPVSEHSISSRDLVPGDIVILQSGDVIPADIRLISCSDLMVNEAMLTGETNDVAKVSMLPHSYDPSHSLSPPNLLFAGTQCTTGSAIGIVIATGMKTRLGKIAKLLSKADEGQQKPPTDDDAARKLLGEEEEKHLLHQSSGYSAAVDYTEKKGDARIGDEVQDKDEEARRHQTMLTTFHGLKFDHDYAADLPSNIMEINQQDSRLTLRPPFPRSTFPTSCPENVSNARTTTNVPSVPPVPALRKAKAPCSCWSSMSRCFQRIVPPARPQTPLQQALHKLGLTMSSIAVIACLIVFIVGVGRGYKDVAKPDEPVWLGMLVLCVSLAVSAIPESLPLATTICLTMGAMRLAKAKTLVRHLPAVEILGTVTVVCSDKTGTITTGQMTLRHMFTQFKNVSVSGKGLDTNGKFIVEGTSAQLQNSPILEVVGTYLALFISGALCNSSYLETNEPVNTKISVHDKVTAKGSSTEIPLMIGALKAGLSLPLIKKYFPRIDEVPFSSQRKLALTLHDNKCAAAFIESKSHTNDLHTTLSSVLTAAEMDELNATSAAFPFPGVEHTTVLSSPYMVCMNGAPNYILPRCSHLLNTNGQVTLCTDSELALLNKMVDTLSSQAYRVIATGYRSLVTLPYRRQAAQRSEEGKDDERPVLGNSPADIEAKLGLLGQGLVFTGLLCLIDPPRDGVADAIQTASKAGVKTIMITGDYLFTASAIAKSITLLPLGLETNALARDASELRLKYEDNKGSSSASPSLYLSNLQIDELVTNTVVWARATPQDKLVIVQSLKRLGHIVGMTGDGVNDSPALQAADIGIAMGGGTAVAQQASQMVITDNNFCTIVSAIHHGRAIYANIQKFVLFLLETNSVQVILILLSVAIGVPVPMLPLPILFINLATAGLASVALSVEHGEAGLMSLPPRHKNESIISGIRVVMLLAHAIALACSMVCAFLIGLYLFSGRILTKDFPLIESSSADGDTLSNNDMLCERFVGINKPWQHLDRLECFEGIAYARTMTFIVIAFGELLRGYTVRHWLHRFWYDFTSNPTMIVGSLLSAGLTLLFIFVGPLSSIFGLTANLPWYAWLLCVALVVLIVVVDERVKLRFYSVQKHRQHWSEMQRQFSNLFTELRSVATRLNHLELLLEQQIQPRANPFSRVGISSTSADID